MKRYLCLLFVIFISEFSLLAQDKVIHTKYDWNPSVIGGGPVRALEVSYHSNSTFDVNSISNLYGKGKGKVDYNRIFKTKLRFPLLLKEKLILAGGLEYSDEESHFKGDPKNTYPLYQSLNDKNLKSIGGNIYLMTQLKKNRFLIFRISAKLKGDYWKEHIRNVNKYTFLKMELSPVIGWKVNSKKLWGVGMAYSYTFGDPMLYPIFVYKHSFADKWGIEAFLPARIKLRYQASKLCFINTKVKLHGGSYSIHFDNTELSDFKTLELRRADVNFSLEIDKGITDWLWASVEYGYRANLNYDVTNRNNTFSLSGSKLTNENSIIDSYAGGGMFFNFSVFIAPSKSLLKKIGIK